MRRLLRSGAAGAAASTTAPQVWTPQATVLVDAVPVRPLQATVHVDTVQKLVAAVEDKTVGRIIVATGTYNLTSDMSDAVCDQSHQGPSALCIGRALTIQAEANGTVVLSGQRKRRVIYVAKGGSAELVGLNITGGYAQKTGVRLRF